MMLLSYCFFNSHQTFKLFQFSLSVKENFTYKSLLTGKYYRLIPSGASYEDYQRQVSLDCVIPNIHCLPEEVIKDFPQKIYFEPSVYTLKYGG